METMTSNPKIKYIPGVEYDADGQPIWYATEEVFDELDKKLIDHFGEEYRRLANDRRKKWNQKSEWRFNTL